MNEGDVARGIRLSWDLVHRFRIGQSVAGFHPLGVNDEFRDIALDAGSSYAEVYVAGCRLRHYNFILNDFSYFQFSIFGEDLRYAFYPNPFWQLGRIEKLNYNLHGEADDEVEIDDLNQLGGSGRGHDMKLAGEVLRGKISIEDYLELVGDTKHRADMPAIRFEHSVAQYREVRHPCAHFHIGYLPQSRWAVARKITPFAFSLLILKYYYPQYWRCGNDDAHLSNGYDRLLAKEKQKCKRLGDQYFTEGERTIFFIS